jgi:RES domain-containing protein
VAGSLAEPRRPLPPPRLGTPALRRIEPGRWWRVHTLDPASGRFGPAEFNDSGRGDARFSPLPAPAGGWVPTLYAAAAPEAALMETVLHDVPYPSQGHIHDLDRDLGSTLHLSAIDIVQPLQLADLTQLGLQRLGLRVSQLFESNADDYPRTRQWAAWVHQALPRAQGLVWMSARHAEHAALMLFGDRVAAGTVLAATDVPPRPLREAAVTATLLALLQRLDCGVAPNR